MHRFQFPAPVDCRLFDFCKLARACPCRIQYSVIIVIAKEQITATKHIALATISTMSVITSDNINGCIPLYCSGFNEEPWKDEWIEETAFERLLTFSRIPRFDGLALSIDGEPIAMVPEWGERR